MMKEKEGRNTERIRERIKSIIVNYKSDSLRDRKSQTPSKMGKYTQDENKNLKSIFSSNVKQLQLIDNQRREEFDNKSQKLGVERQHLGKGAV